MTLGYHSPMPPAPTGVADYSAALVRALSGLHEVAVNPPASYKCDVELFNIGNNSRHVSTLQRALSNPGVVILHDAVLHHFYLGNTIQSQYVEEFVYNYGEWRRSHAEALWRRRAQSAQDPEYFAWPMLRRVVTTARTVVVHNPAAAELARNHGAARVVEIPHIAEPDSTDFDTSDLVSSWGIDPGYFVYGVFGYLRESKRLVTIFDSFRQVHAENPRTALVVAGQFASDELARAVTPRLAEPGVIRVRRLPEPAFLRHLHAVNAVINLRYPSAAETSGIAIRAMGAARCVLLTDGPENSRYPATSCLRVDPGVAESEMLTAYMLWLLRQPQAARDIGQAAARHIQRVHAPAAVARQFSEVCRESR